MRELNEQEITLVNGGFLNQIDNKVAFIGTAIGAALGSGVDFLTHRLTGQLENTVSFMNLFSGIGASIGYLLTFEIKNAVNMFVSGVSLFLNPKVE